jgi:hypothetical protein
MPDRGWRRDNRATRAHYSRINPWTAPPITGLATALLASARAVPAYETRPDFHACAASAVAAAIEIDLFSDVRFTPSVRFLYYVGRYLQRRERENNGASILATLRAAQAFGFCPETSWSLDGAYNEPPTQPVYDEAEQNGIVGFAPVARENVVAVLRSGRPVVFGVLVEDRFLHSPDFSRGIIPPPATAPVDRHSLLAVGYDDNQRFLICRDSLGANRGVDGNINLSYDYVLNNNGWSDDFWYIDGVATPDSGADALATAREAYVTEGIRFRRLAATAYRTAGGTLPLRGTQGQPGPGVIPPTAARIVAGANAP